MGIEGRPERYLIDFDRSQGGSTPGGEPYSPDLHPADMGIRLVSLGDTIHVMDAPQPQPRGEGGLLEGVVTPFSPTDIGKRNGSLSGEAEDFALSAILRSEPRIFRTEARRIPDFGDILLEGSRTYSFIEESHMRSLTRYEGQPNMGPAIGLAIRHGSIETGSYIMTPLEHRDLFLMRLKIELGIYPPDGHELVCQMRIDGVSASYQTTVHNDMNKEIVDLLREIDRGLGITDQDYSGSSYTQALWRNTDPSDPHIYGILVPPDAASLSSLSFSFSLRPQRVDKAP